MPILYMLEKEVHLHSGRVYDTDEFEVVEGERLKVEVTAGLVNALFITLFEKRLPFDGIITNLVLIEEYSGVLAPPHQVGVIFILISIADVIFESQVLRNLDLLDHLSSGHVPCSQILIVVHGHEGIFDSLEADIIRTRSHTEECHLVPVQNWYDLDSLEVVLVGNALLLPIVSKTIGTVAQGILQFEGCFRCHCHLIVFEAEKLGEVLDVEARRVCGVLVFCHVEVLAFNNENIRKIEALRSLILLEGVIALLFEIAKLLAAKAKIVSILLDNKFQMGIM